MINPFDVEKIEVKAKSRTLRARYSHELSDFKVIPIFNRSLLHSIKNYFFPLPTYEYMEKPNKGLKLETLNKLGKDGWELVSTSKKFHITIALFKRQVR